MNDKKNDPNTLGYEPLREDPTRPKKTSPENPNEMGQQEPAEEKDYRAPVDIAPGANKTEI